MAQLSAAKLVVNKWSRVKENSASAIFVAKCKRSKIPYSDSCSSKYSN
jgi:hypothetical protein